MIQHCQDALAINHYFHGANFFLTMTADPNWREIKEALLPGQSLADHPDLAVRVFHAKVEELKADILNMDFLVKQWHMSGPLNFKSVDFLTFT